MNPLRELAADCRRAYPRWPRLTIASCYSSRPRCRVEAIVHELCHAVCLGLSGVDSDLISDTIDAVAPSEADRQEVMALAAELEVLRARGWDLDRKRLLAFAASDLRPRKTWQELDADVRWWSATETHGEQVREALRRLAG